MRSHVQRTVASCFAVLRQLRSIWRSVPSSVYQTLVVALVFTRLDYGNATLAGIPDTLINRLQSALNAAARSIVGLCRSARITDTLVSELNVQFSSVQFPLATRVRANSVQAGGHCLASSSRHCSSISVRPTASRCWHTVKTSSSIVAHWWSWRPYDPPRHCRRPLIFYCRPHAMEQFAKGQHICRVAASVSS